MRSVMGLSPQRHGLNSRLLFVVLVVKDVLVVKFFFQYFGFTLLYSRDVS